MTDVFVVLSFILFLINISACSKKEDGQFHREDKLTRSYAVIGDLDWRNMNGHAGGTPEEVNARYIAEIRIPFSSGQCSGFLISKDILMTNAHCVRNEENAKDIHVLFSYEKGRSENERVEVQCNEFLGSRDDLDFTLLKCQGAPGDLFGHATLSDEQLEEGEDIYVIHQNCDYYNVDNCEFYKKISPGKILKIENDIIHQD